jgi:hypothetical protein
MKLSIRSLAVLAVIAGAAGTTLPAAAQFGGLLGGAKPAAGSANLDQDVKSFLDKSSAIELRVANASVAIAKAYANDEEMARLVSMQEAAKKTTDPKEAGKIKMQVVETAQSIAQKMSNSTNIDDKTKALSAEKKQMLAKGVTLFLSGALQAKELVPTGQSLVSSAATNPMNLTKVAGVKDALPSLTNTVTIASDTIPKLVKALKGANVKVDEPKTSKDKVDVDLNEIS